MHVGCISAAAPFRDWPDSDALVEAIADVFAWSAYEEPFQRQFLGVAQVSPLDNLLAKYSGVILDVAWSLFELRMLSDASQDPNKLWTDITNRFLHIVPHPECAWWARRGQLAEPCYMVSWVDGEGPLFFNSIPVADQLWNCSHCRCRHARCLWRISQWPDVCQPFV